MSANDIFPYILAGVCCLLYFFSMAYQKRKNGTANKQVAVRFAMGALLTFVVLLLLSAAFNLVTAQPPN
jgi:uncharacterized membrane protein SpoIIM required for sporulation